MCTDADENSASFRPWVLSVPPSIPKNIDSKQSGERIPGTLFLIPGAHRAQIKVRITLSRSHLAPHKTRILPRSTNTRKEEEWVMYETYFNLTERPFTSIPRIDHFYPAA